MTAGAQPPAAGPLFRRLLAGLLLAVLAGTLLLLLLEGALRLARVGHDPRFHRQTRNGSEAVVRENRWVTAPYFNRARVRRPQAFQLPAAKAPGTVRVFVLGSSAAMGDPEPSFSLARMLEKLLRDAYPELHFEVVNAGITAINSHVVRHLAEDCAELQPDLFIVYEGHNEVIGPFGPGTVFTPFLRSSVALRVVDALKRTRTGQWVNEAVAARRQAGEEWGGMEMFLERRIRADDPRLLDVRERFADNLRAIARAGERVGAATLVCTVLTNQRDFAPFLSGHAPALGEAVLHQWQEHVDAGDADLAAGRIAAAEERYRAALALDDEHAELVFKLARLALGQQREEEARELFQRALDLDLLRFRTDSRLNETIRGLVAPGLEVVDLARAAAVASAGGVPGEEFLLEHVHLNFNGTYFAAREVMTRVGEYLVRTGRAARTATGSLTLEEMRERLGYTLYEQALIIEELLERYRKPPFTGQVDQGRRVAALSRLQAAANERLAGPEAAEAVFRQYEAALTLDPTDWVLQRNYGMALVAFNALERALAPLERAVAVIEDDPPLLFALGLAQQRTGRSAAAQSTFARLRTLEPDYPGIPPVVRPDR